MTQDLEAKLKDLPDKFFVIIAHLIGGYINDSKTFDHFNDPILNPSIKSLYWLFILQYAVLAILGIVSNIAIIVYVMYHKLYKDVTHAFIINLALCHFVQCAIVLPITLMVMLIQNWIFGQFLCFFLPLLQDIPLHVAMISHLLIAWDRMRWLGDPLRGRLPAFVCCCATWLTGMVIALPYPIYTTYLELGDYVPRLHGLGLCFVNLVDDMHEYMRGLFVIMYCAPATVLAYLYIRTARELRPPDGPFAVMMFEHRADIRNRQRNSSTSSTDRPTRNNSQRSYDLYNAELDVCREKRTQRNLGSMAATQVFCLCPLMILRLAKMVMVETYENSRHFDFTYLMFVWIAFLPTVIFPCIYASEILSRTEKERLRGYFRLSSRRGLKKMQSSQEESGGKENSTEISQDANSNSMERIKNEKSELVTSSNRNKINEKPDKIDTTSVITNGGANVLIDPKKPPFGRLKSTNPTKLTNLHSIKKTIDPINNSCSNITSSTYCNNGGSIDFENTSIVSSDRDSFIERKWINTSLHHKDMAFSDCDTFSRNDSSSTLERDLEIIDLLERERSMDIQDMMEREKRGEIVRNMSVERRKLPDLGKICKSPNPKSDIINKYDNFDYTNVPLTQQRSQMNSRKSSRSSSGRIKRDSLISGNSEIGLFNDREPNKITVIENRIRASRGSTSSGRSSNKSKEHILPSAELDFRDNIFADL